MSELLPTVWYALVATLLTGYAVLDGFGFGAGTLHLFIARDNRERRAILSAIGPLWDGNEVWLIAAGGSLFLSFPTVLGAGLSGFYLPLFMIIWLLIGRGIAIELRSHLADPMWAAFWDLAFGGCSLLLALLLGVALANVLRGVPLSPDATQFHLPLFASFSPFGELGVLDWYSLSLGAFVVIALGRHGALFLARRAGGAVKERAAVLAQRLEVVVAAMWITAATASFLVAPHLRAGFVARPLAWLLGAVAIGGFGWSLRRDDRAFFGSVVHLVAALAATAVCHYPRFLYNPRGAALTVASASPPYALGVGLVWWAIGFPLAVFYFVSLWRMHSRPALPSDDDAGY